MCNKVSASNVTRIIKLSFVSSILLFIMDVIFLFFLYLKTMGNIFFLRIFLLFFLGFMPENWMWIYKIKIIIVLMNLFLV